MNIPAVDMPATRRAFRVGLGSALIMIPQAVVLSEMAGMSAGIGLLTSAIPVLIAILCGSSGAVLSGPNTAICLAIGASVNTMAPIGSERYASFVLFVTVVAGVIQLLLAGLRSGRLFELVPDRVTCGISGGVGISILLSQLGPATGMMGISTDAPWLAFARAASSLGDVHALDCFISAVAIAAGFAARRHLQAPPFVTALVAGGIAYLAGSCIDSMADPFVAQIGRIDLPFVTPKLPLLRSEDSYLLPDLLSTALSIAILGGLQTALIAKRFQTTHGFAPTRELFAQGLSNVVGALFGCYASSGSFNRSAAHVTLGARGRLPGAIAAVAIVPLALALGPLVSGAPLALLAAVLALIGSDMVIAMVGRLRAMGARAMAEGLATAVAVVALGLEQTLLLLSVVAIASQLRARLAPSTEVRERVRRPVSNQAPGVRPQFIQE